MDISKQLEMYEVEYHVLQEEMSAVHRSHKAHGSGIGVCTTNGASNQLTRFQIENEALRRQKTELLDQLQVRIMDFLFHGLFEPFVSCISTV